MINSCIDFKDAPLASSYTPMQKPKERYSDELAIVRGTIYPDLDFPFNNCSNRVIPSRTPLYDVMKYSFVCHDLGLYLDTHPDDETACEYYNRCLQKSLDAIRKYEETSGPLFKSSIYNKNGQWTECPWPWE